MVITVWWRHSALFVPSQTCLPLAPTPQAAGAGDAEAMAHLGHLYANGIAVPQDNATAFDWLYKAAERGAGDWGGE